MRWIALFTDTPEMLEVRKEREPLHLEYASVAGRARFFLVKPRVSKWINRVVGGVFISFGAALLALRRPQ